MTVVRSLMRLVPIDVSHAGRKRDYMLRALDLAFRRVAESQHVDTEFGALHIDWNHDPERFLAYCLHNMLRYYEGTDLGRYIARHGRPGDMFLDVGANLGMYSLLARRRGMTTVVVEPDPPHAAFLTRNAHLYGRVLALALGDRDAELPMYFDPQNTGGTSLVNALGYARAPGTVPVRVFSDLAAAGEFGPLDRVTLVKVDVEGFEVEAVKGMAGAFASPAFRPHIWCEVRGDAAGRTPGTFRIVSELLAAHGYVAREYQNGREIPLVEASLSSRQVYDLLFTPDRRITPRVLSGSALLSAPAWDS